MDPYILLARAEEAERRVRDLELILSMTRVELEQAREHARHWEEEAKDLRKQIQRLRMECDTERITNKPIVESKR